MLEKLPAEVLTYIFSCLPLSDLKKIRLVNTWFSEIVSTSGVWSHRNLEVKTEPKGDSDWEQFQKLCIKRLVVSRLERSPKINDVSASSVTFVDKVFRYVPLMKELSVNLSAFLTMGHMYKRDNSEVKRVANTLKKLYVQCDSRDKDLLRKYYTDGTTVTALLDMQKFPNLIELGLECTESNKHCLSVDAKQLSGVLYSLKHLQILTLRNLSLKDHDALFVPPSTPAGALPIKSLRSSCVLDPKSLTYLPQLDHIEMICENSMHDVSSSWSYFLQEMKPQWPKQLCSLAIIPAPHTACLLIEIVAEYVPKEVSSLLVKVKSHDSLVSGVLQKDVFRLLFRKHRTLKNVELHLVRKRVEWHR